MTELEEHQRRVEQAQEALVDDVRQLGRVRRQLASQAALLASGAVVVGILLVRSAWRRRRRVRSMRPPPSVARDAFRVLVVELVRQLARNVAPRLLASGKSTPQLMGTAAPSTGGPRTRRDGPVSGR